MEDENRKQNIESDDGIFFLKNPDFTEIFRILTLKWTEYNPLISFEQQQQQVIGHRVVDGGDGVEWKRVFLASITTKDKGSSLATRWGNKN